MGKDKSDEEKAKADNNLRIVNLANYSGRGEGILNQDARLKDAYESIVANGQKIKRKKK